ncbi:unnamed protein product [Ceutorhynchus assimilis]|uniref:Myb-like domain-containing protein n=1 Tax=Ceutorhynchus assimilis TaxID=467358 RepID=A0A9N9MI00_9CUCU|nr:unnamed protein product [Ceutorhynchus assimilis]
MGLSDIENRISSILGITFYKGVARPENGLSSFVISKPNLIKEIKIVSKISNLPSTSCQENISSQEQALDIRRASSSQKDIYTQQRATMIGTVALRRQLVNHDYLKAPMQNPKRFKSKNEDLMETMYKETISELKEMKVCLQDSTNSNKDMEFAQQLLSHAKNEHTVPTVEVVETYHLQEEDTNQDDPFSETQPSTSFAEDNLEVNQAWSQNETLALISAYESHKENFNVAKKRKFGWLDIANEVNSNGYQRSAAKCETKWRNLLRTYKNVKDIQEKSCRGACRFRFYNRMGDILDDKPSTSSPHPFSSTKPATIVNEEEEVMENKTLETDKNKKVTDESTPKLIPKRKRV